MEHVVRLRYHLYDLQVWPRGGRSHIFMFARDCDEE